jgi:precorrin-2 dehydrogenase / sirohydrochlorin ferrochelatase
LTGDRLASHHRGVSERPSFYPIFLDLHGRQVLIAGGGSVSERKAEALIRCGARVTVVAPDCTDTLRRLADQGALTWKQKRYVADDLGEAALVLACTDVPAVNEQIAADCRLRGILVNVIDSTPLCDFIVPAVVDRGSVQIAISTSGKSPALARVVKRDIRNAIGPEHEELNDILGSLREAAKASARLPTDSDRKRFFDDLLALGILQMLREGRRREAYAAVAETCRENGVAASELVAAGLDGAIR